MRGATLRKLFLKVFFERYTKLSELVSSKCPVHSFKKNHAWVKESLKIQNGLRDFFITKDEKFIDVPSD